MTKEEFDLNKGGRDYGSCSGMGLWSLLNRCVQVLPLCQLSWMLCPWPGVTPNIQSGTVQLLLKEAPLSSFPTPTTVLSALAVAPGSRFRRVAICDLFPRLRAWAAGSNVGHTCVFSATSTGPSGQKDPRSFNFHELCYSWLLTLFLDFQSLASGALDSDRLEGPLLSPGPI